MRSYLQIGILLMLVSIASLCGATAFGVSDVRRAVSMLMSTQSSTELSPTFVQSIMQIISGTEITAELEELLTDGYLQEVIWRLRDIGDVDRAVQLEQELLQVLAHDDIVDIDTQVRSRGHNFLHVVRFANGVRGVLKHGYSERSAGREELAYHFDRLVGLDVFPLTVFRKLEQDLDILQMFEITDKGWGAMQLFMPHAADAAEIAMFIALRRAAVYGDIRAWAFAGVPDELRKDKVLGNAYSSFIPPMQPRIGTLKFLIGDADDAHAGNYMFPVRGRSFTVDADFAFERDTLASSPIVDAEHINRLFDNPHEYFTDTDFIARLENLTLEQIEAALQPLIDKYTECTPSGSFAGVCIRLKERIEDFVDIVSGKGAWVKSAQ